MGEKKETCFDLLIHYSIQTGNPHTSSWLSLNFCFVLLLFCLTSNTGLCKSIHLNRLSHQDELWVFHYAL